MKTRATALIASLALTAVMAVPAVAQEMAEPVLRKHVAAYVNDFSLELGEKGRAAIDRLESMAWQKGVLT